jgi:hypothetical protein
MRTPNDGRSAAPSQLLLQGLAAGGKAGAE